MVWFVIVSLLCCCSVRVVFLSTMCSFLHDCTLYCNALDVPSLLGNASSVLSYCSNQKL